MGGATNSSFLALILKEHGASILDRFRPISLCNTSYKIMVKIIANRLNLFLIYLILPNQGGFVAGKQIWEKIMLVKEVIHSRKSRGELGMEIKLDMENAFDRVEHDFLFKFMKKIGFNQEFLSWKEACTTSPWIASLLNGSSNPFFRASK